MPIRVAAIDDHPLILKAIVQELQSQDDIQVVGTAAHGSDLQALVRETSPNVVVLDLGMSTGEFEPVSAVRALRDAYPEVEVLVLTGYDDGAWVRELIDSGVQGYVLKSDDLSLCLPEGVRRVHAGGRFYSPAATEKYFARDSDEVLTGQEIDLLNLAARGCSNERIAEFLGFSAKTVRNYFHAIYGKLGIETGEGLHPRVAVINRAREMGLLREED
jgi:DNA-binding NarL/FixJ family response regulator